MTRIDLPRQVIRKRAYMFIDGGYIRNIVRKTFKREDILNDIQKYARFLELLKSTCPLNDLEITRIFYYDAIVPINDDPEKHKKQREFFNKLQLQSD